MNNCNIKLFCEIFSGLKNMKYLKKIHLNNNYTTI